jgi:hypothetical protein
MKQHSNPSKLVMRLRLGNNLRIGAGLVRERRRLDLKLVRGVRLYELDEGLKGAVTVVVDEVLRARRLELQGRETGDAERSAWGDVVLGRVHLRARLNG